MPSHVNIPIFIPEKACPHRCIFCNQANISGQKVAPKPSEVKAIIDTYLNTIPSDRKKQVAFFGGSFTGIAIEEQKEYLEVVAPYIENRQIEGIRVSTRPDYIDITKLELLKSYHVKAIELGAQSFNQEVLHLSSRGHTVEDTINAAGLINEYGFELGLQMMLGLPGDTAESATFTAQEIVRLKAQTTRIYPALVIV
ncbi:MAG: radical SAM protein [Bacteroidales bacterium]|nr:radical SAM protein [Bacteroidales bacterium]